MKGTVKWFNEKNGHGFITAEDGQAVFVVYINIQTDGFQTLHSGQQVTFTIKETPRGPMALNVVIGDDNNDTDHH